MKNDVCVIVAYFGTFPNYFQLFLKTCSYNDKIDFLFFSDAHIDYDLPDNVKIIQFSLGKMKELAERKMSMTVALNRAYKCCDFKPAYGVIFSDYISKYEYWGHCDIDLMFGDIYSFLMKNNYHNYDKFLPLGHLCFYRNSPEVNHYYELPGSKNGDYKKVFTCELPFAFDELGGMVEIYKENNLPMFTERIFADITHVYKRWRLSEHCHIGKKDVNYPYQIFYWKDGKVYRSYIVDGDVHTDEYMYIHFKKRPNFRVEFSIENQRTFLITSKGFIPVDDITITKELIQRYNRYNGLLYESIELMLFNLKKKKNNLLSRIEREKYEKRNDS